MCIIEIVYLLLFVIGMFDLIGLVLFNVLFFDVGRFVVVVLLYWWLSGNVCVVVGWKDILNVCCVLYVVILLL